MGKLAALLFAGTLLLSGCSEDHVYHASHHTTVYHHTVVHHAVVHHVVHHK